MMGIALLLDLAQPLTEVVVLLLIITLGAVKLLVRIVVIMGHEHRLERTVIDDLPVLLVLSGNLEESLLLLVKLDTLAVQTLSCVGERSLRIILVP